VDEWNYQFCKSMVQGGEHLGYSVRGWHRLLWEAGIPVDFVEASELDQPYVSEYKALVVPFPLSMSERVAGRLARYLESGGNLICEAAPGRLDEHAYAVRGELRPSLRDLFGVRQTSFTMVAEPDGGSRWSPTSRTWGEYLQAAMLEGTGTLAGHRVRANAYIEAFECHGGEPCLYYGDAVAGTMRTVGGGRAWLLGTYIGHNGTAYREEESRAFVIALLGACGVAPAHTGQLLLRKRVSAEEEAWLFTNPTADAVTESIDVSGWDEVADLFGAHLERDGDTVGLRVPSLDVRVLIASQS
jgi:hypothetical protein